MERDLSVPGLSLSAYEETQSAVSWAAIFAGAVAALALSFVLITLCAGFGFAHVAPWSSSRATSAAFTPIVGSLMVCVQVLSCALGGYLAGRLRTKWLNVHSHEVHFRDTAHGLLVWASSTVVSVVLAGAVLAPPAEHLAVNAARTAVSPASANPSFTADGLAPAGAATDAQSLRVAAVREANITAQLSFFVGIGLLLSAFTASVAAALGGLQRDEMHAKFWDQ